MQIGKAGKVYVLDQNALGGFQAGPGGTDQVIDNGVQIGTQTSPPSSENFYGCPTYYTTSSGGHVVFVSSSNGVGPVYCYTFDNNGKLSTSTPSTTGDNFKGYGTIPVVSSNASFPGTGIVWVIRNTLDGNTEAAFTSVGKNTLSLLAYDAENLGAASIVNLPCGTWPKQGSFLVPTVADGKVFVGSDGQLTVFGLQSGLA